MTLNELIEQLQDIVDQNPELGEENIKVAQQPSYPLASTIANVTVIEDDEDEDSEPTVWIALREARDYAPHEAWN